MSEAATKRIALTTLSAPAKKENKEKEKQHESSKAASGRQPELKTHRFVLTLPNSTEESCPEFNFADLLSSVSQPQKKKDISTPHLNGSGPPPLDPFASDDEDQLRNIAKKFEEKYGVPVGKKKKSKKYDEYVDLGAGYDETDPFIDNTDAYDEIVPAELTTAHGGFYINSGALEFKPVEEGEEGPSESGESGETESSSNESESDESDSEPNVPRKRRVIESDEEDSKDEGSPRNGKETALAAVNGSGEGEVKRQTKKRIRLDDMVLKPSKKTSAESQEVAPAASAPSVPASASTTPAAAKKARPTVKELLQQKREKEKDAIDIKELPASAAKSGSDSGSDSSDSSSDSSDSDSESGSEGEGEEDGEEGKDSARGDSADVVKTLPSNLPSTLTVAIEDIKKAAAASSEQGKCRFFSSEVNRFLLSIELLSRQLSCSKRQAVFSYLATFLPCTKHTLLKRAKNLVLESVEAQLKGAMKKLQGAIEKVIPEQIERHANECLLLAEANPERYIEYYRYAWDPELEPAGATDGEDEKSEAKAKNIPPRRRFQWNKDIRLLLNQVVYLKAECFHWSKLRKESAEEYLTRFLDTEVKSLWPKGWMSTKILFKESKEAHTFITSKLAPKLSPGSKKSGSALLAGFMDTLALPPASQSHTASSSSVPATVAPTAPTVVPPTASSTLPVPSATPPTLKESKKPHPPREKVSPASTPSRVDTLNQSKPEGMPSKRPESTSSTGANSTNSVTINKPETGHNRTDPVPMSCRSEGGNVGKSRTEATALAYARSEKSNQPQVLDSLSISTAHSHQPSKVDSGSSRHRQESNNHNSSSSRPISESVTKPEHPGSDAGRSRSEAGHMPKPSTGPTIHVRPDLCVARPDRSDSGSKRSDPNPKADLGKGRPEGHHSTPSTHKTSDSLSDSMKSNRFESPSHFSRVDSMQIQSTSKSSDSSLQAKAEAAPNPKSDVKPHKSKMASSLASFVDSGFQWKEQAVPDVEEKSSRSAAPSSDQSRASLENSRSVESSTPRQHHEEPEDEESMLQRDLAMVMEELTRQADIRDDPPPKSDARTKSVIKSTGSVTPQAPPVSGPQPPPKMPSPTVSVLSKTTPVSRTSPLPAAAPPISPIAASKMTSPNNNPSGSSRLVSPQSLNHPLSLSVSNLANETSNAGSNLSKYGGAGLIKSEYLTPPTAHTSSSSSSSSNRQHLGSYYGPPDISQHAGSSINMHSPDKRKSEPSAPLPAHQQHSSTSMSRNTSIFRNYPTSAQSVTTSPAASSVSPVSSRTPSTYHSIESLMQNRSVADSFSPSTHRSPILNIPQPQQSHQQQPQHQHLHQQQQHSIPKIPDPFAMFLPQKNSTQRGSGHHQHSS